MDADEQAPVACTLTTKAAASQILEWGDLQQRANAVDRIENGARMTFPAAARGAVEDLARREQSCCAFLTITTAVTGDELTLEISSGNPDAVPIIEALAGLGPS